jgi:hypothetical protein
MDVVEHSEGSVQAGRNRVVQARRHSAKARLFPSAVANASRRTQPSHPRWSGPTSGA